MLKKIILIIFASFTAIKSCELNNYSTERVIAYQKQFTAILAHQDKIAPIVKSAGFAIGAYATFRIAKAVFNHLGIIGNDVTVKKLSAQDFNIFAKSTDPKKQELQNTLTQIANVQIDTIDRDQLLRLREAYLIDRQSNNVLIVGDQTKKAQGFLASAFSLGKETFLWTVGLGGILGFDSYFTSAAMKILMQNYYINTTVNTITDCMQVQYDFTWFFDRHVKWYHDVNNLQRACTNYANLTQRVDNMKNLISKKYSDNFENEFEKAYEETAINNANQQCKNIKRYYNIIINDAEKIIGFMGTIVQRAKDSDMYETVLNEAKFSADTIREALSDLNIHTASLLENKCRNLSNTTKAQVSINTSIEIINERINSFNQLLK